MEKITITSDPEVVIAVYNSIFTSDVKTIIKKLDESDREGGVLPYYSNSRRKALIPEDVKKYFEEKIKSKFVDELRLKQDLYN
jgi:hypothetical protein